MKQLTIKIYALLLLVCSSISCAGQSNMVDKILFDSEVNSGDFELYTISPDGKGLKQHTFDAVPRRGNSGGQFSPNGKFVLFSTYKYGGWKIAIANSDFSEQRKLTPGPHYTYPGSWAPDSKKVVYNKVDAKSAPYFQGDMEIYVMNLDGTGDTNLTKHEGPDFSPKWSPDGKKILFFSDRSGNYDLFVMDVDGSNLQNLTNSPQLDEFAPSWSPNSGSIAFHSMKKTNGKRYIELNIMKADGSARRQLTDNSAEHRNLFVPYFEGAHPIFYGTCWSPDGREIVFSSKRNSKNFELFVIQSDGSGIRQLTDNGVNNVFPFWYKDQ